jgi:hypothetical protein
LKKNSKKNVHQHKEGKSVNAQLSDHLFMDKDTNTSGHLNCNYFASQKQTYFLVERVDQIVSLASRVMLEQVLLKDFRAAGNGSTIMCYNRAENAWVCGDSGGSIYTLARDGSISDMTARDSPITSMAISPLGDLCAITTDKQLDIHRFPDVESVHLSLAMRTELDITHTAYDNDGAHM